LFGKKKRTIERKEGVLREGRKKKKEGYLSHTNQEEGEPALLIKERTAENAERNGGEGKTPL